MQTDKLMLTEAKQCFQIFCSVQIFTFYFAIVKYIKYKVDNKVCLLWDQKTVKEKGR